MIAFGCVAGCAEPQSDEGTSQTRGEKPPAIDTAQSLSSTARSHTLPEVRFGDSATFDPDGYYLPRPEVIRDSLELDSFEVRTLEYSYDGALHYERPRLHVPKVTARIKDLRRDTYSDRECDRVSVNRDGLRLECPGTALGDLSVEATYVDRRGRYWNIIDYELEPKTVARGRLIIRRSGDTLTVTDLAFVYTGGH